jgi:hypothetical protein
MSATCSYQTNPLQNGADGACLAQQSVPAGCPIYFVTSQDAPPSAFTISVIDAHGSPVTATATTSSLGIAEGRDSYVDLNDCSCPTVSAPITIHLFATQVPAAKAGDFVAVDLSGAPFEGPPVEITAAASCPPPDWQVDFSHLTACDPCQSPEPHKPDGYACGVGSGPSGLVVAALVVVAVQRAARRRHRTA